MYYIIDFGCQKQYVIFDTRTNRLGSMVYPTVLIAARKFKRDSWVIEEDDRLHIANNIFTAQGKQHPIIATVKSIQESYLKTNYPELLI